MIKPASSACNLACDYCFYKDVASKRAQANFGIMTEETSRAVIKSFIEFADGGRIFFVFQGGEPTLAGLDYFKNFVRDVDALNDNGTTVFYSLQTNGTLLDEQWAAFLSERRFLVGLSLDGDRKGNRHRRFPTSEPVFDKVVASANLLTKYNVDFNVLTVLTSEIANNAEKTYAFFKRNNLRYLQFVPCLNPFDTHGGYSPSATEYGNFLIKTFKLYAADYLKGESVSERKLDNFVRSYLGLPAELCGMNGHCNAQFVVEANGNVYPCDFYCTDKYLLGNVCTDSLKDMAEGPIMRDFLKESLVFDRKCTECKHFPICRGGGCKREKASVDYCEAYKMFFDECLPSFSVFENNR